MEDSKQPTMEQAASAVAELTRTLVGKQIGTLPVVGVASYRDKAAVVVFLERQPTEGEKGLLPQRHNNVPMDYRTTGKFVLIP